MHKFLVSLLEGQEGQEFVQLLCATGADFGTVDSSQVSHTSLNDVARDCSPTSFPPAKLSLMLPASRETPQIAWPCL
jgi:hypothetical protein